MTDRNKLAGIIKRQRLMRGLTLAQLSVRSGVSAPHLGRIEKSERPPSLQVIHRIAKPLGFEEIELLTLAGYLSPQPPSTAESQLYGLKEVDPYVARVLAQEPVETQQAVIGIFTVLKYIASSTYNRHKKGGRVIRTPTS
ncbi:MAG: helix-turn-helix domain-containing protein [Dehalococcoidia bacterium]|nr:helix-turn-helix domain-containing protein [Dehalococcoidia bacterium]